MLWCETFASLIFSKNCTNCWTISISHSLLHWSLDWVGFYEFFLPHFYFTGSSTIQCYKLISCPYNLGGIVVSIILLFYLASCFLILWSIRALVCYNLIVWYKEGIEIGLIKMDTYNIPTISRETGSFLNWKGILGGGSTIQF